MSLFTPNKAPQKLFEVKVNKLVKSGREKQLQEDVAVIVGNFSEDEIALLAKVARNSMHKEMAVSALKKYLG